MNDHLGVSLSALIDGNLDAAERAAAEAHLRACAACRAEQFALHDTLSDLRALERPALTDLDRARLRSEVRRAHKVPRSALRLSAAAAVVALVAGGALFLTRDGGGPATDTYAAAIVEDGNYTEEAARALLLDGSGSPPTMTLKTPAQGSADAASRGAPAPASAEATTGGPAEDAGAIQGIDHGARIAECEGIFLGTDDVIRVRRIVARYEGEPAYLLTYRAPRDEPTHTELWVVSIAGCEIRFFAQEEL